MGVEKGCGRMKNRLLHLEGGGRVCCRYRQNQDQIQGEVFSFYLSRAIGQFESSSTIFHNISIPCLTAYKNPFLIRKFSKLGKCLGVGGGGGGGLR